MRHRRRAPGATLTLALTAVAVTGLAPTATAAPRTSAARTNPAAAASAHHSPPTSPPATSSGPPSRVVPGVPLPTPPAHYVNTTMCVQPANIGAALKNGVSWAQTQLGFTSVWPLGRRGAGQTIAVIDTGVNPEAAFGSRLRGGGDYVVAGGDGLQDCDGHGTIVAGIMAASPDPHSGYAGVAPDAHLVSIRQSSLDYGVPNAKQGTGENVAGTTVSLAQAIRLAVATGAKIINISEASCRPAGAPPDQGTAAIRAAVQSARDSDVVIVAAAGNIEATKDCKSQNLPGRPPVTIPVPAGLPGVLTVGAVDENGLPAAFSLAGPWVDVAAPGVDIAATDPLPGTTGQVNRIITSSGTSPIQGTSFAAPYVAGLVALVRARFPSLHAPQVIARITRTAEHPAAAGDRNDYVGYGMIDPEAALTAVLPGETPPAPSPRHGPQRLPAAQPHADPERGARQVALLGTLGLAVAIVVGVIVTGTRRRAGQRARREPGSGRRAAARPVGGRR